MKPPLSSTIKRRIAIVAASFLLAALSGCASMDNQGIVVEPIEAPAAPKVVTESASSRRA